jgi:hypothetical protein
VKADIPANLRRTVFVCVTCIFLLTWAGLWLFVGREWQRLREPYLARFWFSAFLVFFPVPWLNLVINKCQPLKMALLTYLALFLAVSSLFALTSVLR